MSRILLSSWKDMFGGTSPGHPSISLSLRVIKKTYWYLLDDDEAQRNSLDRLFQIFESPEAFKLALESDPMIQDFFGNYGDIFWKKNPGSLIEGFLKRQIDFEAVFAEWFLPQKVDRPGFLNEDIFLPLVKHFERADEEDKIFKKQNFLWNKVVEKMMFLDKPERLKILSAHNLSAYDYRKKSTTLLVAALKNKKFNMFQDLILWGLLFKPDQRLADERTWIHRAIDFDNVDAVAFVIGLGVDPNAEDGSRYCPLEYLLYAHTREDRRAIAHILLQNGVDINMPFSKSKNTLLSERINAEDWSLAQFAIENGADFYKNFYKINVYDYTTRTFKNNRLTPWMREKPEISDLIKRFFKLQGNV